MFGLLYDFCLLLIGLLALPKYLFRKKFSHRFQVPEVDSGGRSVVWIHAVSVGETKAVAKLAKRIKSEKPDAFLLISSITETGHAEAKRSLPFADAFIYLPFDFSWIIRPLVKRLRPKLVIITETDLWYNFLKSAKEGSAKTVLVNGKISERSFQRMRWVPFFASRLYALIDLFLVQNEEYKQRFLSLGVSEAKIHSTGNLKLDEEADNISQAELAVWKKQLGLQNGDTVIVIGSTHPQEEKLLLNALQPLFRPNLKILVVPRHPERFQEVADILRPLNPGRLSVGTTGNVMLIDAMGLLKKCFQVADLAIMGGSFVPDIGGHNILEPSLYAVPVLFGPYMHNQPDFVRLLLQSRGGEQVPLDQLYDRVNFLLSHPDIRITQGNNGKALLTQMRGATNRTWERILDT